MKEKIKISVILPVYNGEKYIRECIESILNQTLKEIEIIVVNDGTKDSSMDIVREYLDDKRIKIIDKENGGVSSARNVGLALAKGEYIFFVDNDDYLEENMLEDLYNKSENVDIVFSDYFDYYMNDNKVIKGKRNFFFENTINKGSYVCMYTSAVVWNKIYRKDFLEKNNLIFLEGIIHEDDLFTIKACFLADKIKYIEKPYYYYRRNRDGSIMADKTTDKNLKNYKIIYDELKEFYNKFTGTDFEKLRLFLLKSYYFVFKCRLEKEVNKKDIKKFEEELKKYYNKLKLSELEKRIIHDDIQRVLKNREYSYINIFDKFYWKNSFINKKIFRRIVEEKIKRLV